MNVVVVVLERREGCSIPSCDNADATSCLNKSSETKGLSMPISRGLSSVEKTNRLF